MQVESDAQDISVNDFPCFGQYLVGFVEISLPGEPLFIFAETGCLAVRGHSGTAAFCLCPFSPLPHWKFLDLPWFIIYFTSYKDLLKNHFSLKSLNS